MHSPTKSAVLCHSLEDILYRTSMADWLGAAKHGSMLLSCHVVSGQISNKEQL